MNANEQKAFVEAYDNTICNIPRDKVADFVRLYENKEYNYLIENYPSYEYSSIVDALGTWHYACAWQLKQLQGVTA